VDHRQLRPLTLNEEEPVDIKRHNAGPRMSAAVVHSNTVYLAGQVASDPSLGTKEQTQQVLEKIDKLLASAGSDKSKLLSATVYIANMSTFAEMNAAWDAWVTPGQTPARATVEARLAQPKLLVEIMVIAAV
jgi:enamine deaminase RidA (YjgF/YER057c/UK114 family)